MWLHNIEYKKNDIGKLLILNSDNSWMKIQKYATNVKLWKEVLSAYNWDTLFEGVDSIDYESKIDQFLYPTLINIGATSGYSKLVSKNLKIKSRECKFNPDWDGDVILKLFNLFAQNLKWTPPKIPKIKKRVEGKKFKYPLINVSKIGLEIFVKDNNVFSYAITNPKIFSYTVFENIKNDK